MIQYSSIQLVYFDNSKEVETVLLNTSQGFK